MQEFRTEYQEKASAILKSVEGLSIAEAQWLLKWCSEYLMEQKVCFAKSTDQD